MQIYIRVTAQDLLDAGAPLNVIRQSYRKQAGFEEKVKTESLVEGVTDAKIVYEATSTSREQTYYYLPAKTDAKTVATAVASGSDLKVVYGGSIKDSYVLVTAPKQTN